MVVSEITQTDKNNMRGLNENLYGNINGELNQRYQIKPREKE